MIPVNPPAEQLGATHAILWGRGNRSYHVGDFPGPLSIKSMVRGRGEWRAAGQRFELDPRSGYLLLNDRQPYSITIESTRPVETFCVFFRRGFVEDAWRSTTACCGVLLDEPAASCPVLFRETIHARDSLIQPILDRMYAAIAGGGVIDESSLLALAEGLAYLRPEMERMLGRLPAAKASTRVELARRLRTAREFLESAVPDSSVELDDVARAAALSPFHLHRSFHRLFGETPRDYLSRRRMETAAGLLRQTDAPVTEICLQCGFDSLGSFSTSFRERFAASPREFRGKLASGKKN